MIYDLLKSIALVVLVLLVLFFILGNISLMNFKTDQKIKTRHDITRVSPELNEIQENKVVSDELEAHNQHVLQLNDQHCHSAKDQIMRNALLKQQQAEQSDMGILKQLAPFLDTAQKAPILENFEDYAPVDTPTNLTPKHIQLMEIRKGDNFDPKAANELDLHRPSKFESERRAPWADKMGKDDLSYFFNTHTFDQTFDGLQKQPVVCPAQWEKDAMTQP